MLGAPLSFADDFSEFRIPPNRALLWNASLGAAAQGGDTSQPGAQYSGGDLNGGASSAFQWFSDSDPAFTSLAAGFAVLGDRSHGTAENDFFSPTATTVTIPSTITLTATASDDKGVAKVELLLGTTLLATLTAAPYTTI